MAKGFLHVVTTPVPGDIYINDEYRGTSDLNVELDPGIYTVSFGDVAEHITPSPLIITVNSGYETVVTAEYIKI